LIKTEPFSALCRLYNNNRQFWDLKDPYIPYPTSNKIKLLVNFIIGVNAWRLGYNLYELWRLGYILIYNIHGFSKPNCC
jgi:hypothetical protein